LHKCVKFTRIKFGVKKSWLEYLKGKKSTEKSTKKDNFFFFNILTYRNGNKYYSFYYCYGWKKEVCKTLFWQPKIQQENSYPHYFSYLLILWFLFLFDILQIRSFVIRSFSCFILHKLCSRKLFCNRYFALLFFVPENKKRKTIVC
jgi:hypothetical protein